MTLIVVVLSYGAALDAQQVSERLAGRRLADALRLMQDRGLRLVFSSEIVTPAMRVASEPLPGPPRRQLDELLAPHNLKAEQGPGATIVIVRARPAAAPRQRKNSRGPERASPPSIAPAPTEPNGFSERIDVRAERPGLRDIGAGSALDRSGGGLEDARGTVADDPLQAMRALPRVAAIDDFRSEFSVRGSAYRHIGVVVDGVPTPWLTHAAQGRGEGGSIAMIGSDVVDTAALRVGAYPLRYGDGLGAQVDLTLREGSRASNVVQGGVDLTHATVTAEGPLGRSRSGSWLFAVRRSHLDRPLGHPGVADGTMLGFTDMQSKLVFDVSARQQLLVTMLDAWTSVDENDDRPAHALGDGMNRTSLLNAEWRSTLGSRTLLSQRTYFLTHRYLNQDQSGQERGSGADRDISYRLDVSRQMPGGVLETGGQVQSSRAWRRLAPGSADSIADALTPSPTAADAGLVSLVHSGYAHFTWAPGSRVTIAPGLRITHATTVRRPTVGRWVLGRFSLRPDWTLMASAGVTHQLPSFDHLLATGVRGELGAERAVPVDVGVEHQLTPSIRWQVTLFSREERELLSRPDRHQRRVEGMLVEPLPEPGYENALRGRSRGVELLFERQSAERLSGWAAYSFGKTRHTDTASGEMFWADFDQRHAFNASAAYRVSDRTRIGATFRGGTSFPIPGYLAATEDGLVAGERRNEVRLPPYARLDLRATRAFDIGQRRVTLFVEVLNVLNRTQFGPANGYIAGDAGRAVGFTRQLLPRLPSAGVTIQF